MRDRRQGLMTDTGHARRWNDKLFSFIFFCLLVFLLGMILACEHVQVNDQGRTSSVNCKDPYFRDDIRCEVYVPESEEVDFEAVESVDLETVEFD